MDTQYGRINELQVPKLRARNRERDWQILGRVLKVGQTLILLYEISKLSEVLKQTLERYQRGIQGFLDWVCYLYVLGLSLRDLQVLL